MAFFGKLREKLKWQNLREHKLVANTIEQLEALSPEQRRGLTIAFAVGGVLVLGIILFKGYGAVSKLKTNLSTQQAELNKISTFSEGYREFEEDLTRIQSEIRRRPKTFSLQAFVAEQIAKAGIPKEIISGVKEELMPPKGDLQEVVVEVKLSRVSLKRLTNLIFGLERSQNVTRVKDLHIKVRTDDNRFLDSTFAVSTVREAPK